MSAATTFGGTPLSWAHDEYVRRNVSQVARPKLAASPAGHTHVRRTLFGEIGFPETVQKIRSSAAVRRARVRHSSSSCTAVSDNGRARTLADVLGVSNVPS